MLGGAALKTVALHYTIYIGGAMKKKAKNRKWIYHGKRIERVPDLLRTIPVRCRRCVWRSNKYVAFCERVVCIYDRK